MNEYNDLKHRVRALEEQVEKLTADHAKLLNAHRGLVRMVVDHENQLLPPLTPARTLDLDYADDQGFLLEELTLRWHNTRHSYVFQDEPSSESWTVVCKRCGRQERITAVQLAQPNQRVPMLCECGVQLLDRKPM